MSSVRIVTVERRRHLNGRLVERRTIRVSSKWVATGSAAARAFAESFFQTIPANLGDC